MMQYVPYYTVSYHGVFHPAGIPFEIEEADVPEMAQHGEILMETEKQTKRNRPQKN